MSHTMAKDAERVIVRNADDMSLDDFALHMEHRHGDSLGGADTLPTQHMGEDIEELWRSFHDQLHRLRLAGDTNHDHGRRRQ